MTLTELKYIVAVARERHFGKAAEACFISQPTLSVAVKKLEEELDVKLFERSANEVTVTPLGEEIVRQAQSVLEQAANIKEIAKRGKNPLTGPLTLGVIYTIGPYLLPDLVRQMIARTPEMPLILQENFTVQVCWRCCARARLTAPFWPNHSRMPVWPLPPCMTNRFWRRCPCSTPWRPRRR
jgi:LysR family hydrogen peroxide-inducible transcriptional activator